jgi:hypothetical protein
VEEPSSSLKEVRVPIIDNEYCQWMIYREMKQERGVVIDDRKLCAGEQGKSACSVFSDFFHFNFILKMWKLGNHFAAY